MTPEYEYPQLEGVPYGTGEEQRAIINNSIKKEAAGLKQKWHPVVDVYGGKSKVWCYKEQCCMRTWNVRSMNQGKLDVVKQEMEKLNINILGISELQNGQEWENLIQMTIVSTTVGKNPIEEIE